MEFKDVIAARRSIRKFKSDPVEKEKITAVLEAARLAPSGTNAQPWKLMVIQNDETRGKLFEATYNQKMFAQAPAVIAVLGDRKIYKKRLRRGKELVELGAVDAEVMETVSKVYKGREDSADIGISMNCMIAAEHVILEATNQNLGTCWVMLMDKEKVAEALNLPKNLFPVALIPLGYADQEPKQRPRYELSEIAYSENADIAWEE